MTFGLRRGAVLLTALATVMLLVVAPARAVETAAALPDNPVCETVPDVYDSEGNSENFCDDPAGWVQLVIREARSFCGGRCHPVFLVCVLSGNENCEG